MPQPARRPILRYGCAVVSVALMTWLRLNLPIGDRHRFVTFFFAILFTAWYGGLGPSILATILACLAGAYFLIPPYHTLLVTSVGDLLGIGLFVAVCSAIVAFSEAGRATRRLLEREVGERRRAEQSEREQRERHQTTLSSIGDGVIVTDAVGRVASLNPVAEGLTGWSSADAAGRPLSEVFRTLDRATHRTADLPVAEVVAGGVVRRMDRRDLVARDGSALAIEHCTSPIVAEAGTVNGVVIVFRDVTERMRAEEALRESEERFARFMQQLPGLAWIKDAEGRYVYANDATERAFRVTPAALYGRTDDEVFPPDTAARFKENDRRALASGTGVQVVETLEHADGTLHYSLVSKFPITAPDGRAALVGGMAIDVTEGRRAEEALRQSEEQFRTLADSIPQLAWMARPDGQVFWYNRRWYDYTGTCFEEMEGEGWQSVHDPADLPRILAKFRGALATGEPWEDTFPLRRHDGAMRWHLSRALPVRDERGRVVRWFGTNTDVTERMQMEEALKEADRRKDEFLATLAHELRNPLAPIRNALHLMGGSDGEGRGFEADRAMAERQVVHLARLIDDLMDIARISRGKIELRREPLELAPVVVRAIESVRSSLEGRRHALEVTLPDGPLYLDADPTRLEQVFWNLLNNAIKYTEPGGSIRVAVGREGGEVVVRVRDTGVGIEPAMLPRVFEMFVQVGDDPERSQGGLGIGLSLVSTLVGMHGGRVTAHSDGRGEGTEFVVRLPALADAPRGRDEGGRAGPAGPAPDLPRRRVLVVDDNVDAARSLARLLTRVYGQDVRVAHDGPAALGAVEGFSPEVVLLDIGMPGMDGYEVARRMRRQPESEAALMVALTGWGQESDRQKSREAGFDHHLVKPVDPDALRHLLTGDEPAG